MKINWINRGVILPVSILAMAFVILTNACNNIPPLTKKGYIKDFVLFINEVEMDNEKYTDEDWKKADSRFEKYADVYYDKFKSKMDSNEISKVNHLKGKYIGIKIKGKSDKMVKEIISTYKSLIEESKGIFETLMIDIDSLAM